MTLHQALQQAAAQGLARLDAQLGRPGTDRGWLIAHDDTMLAPPLRETFSALCRRRADGEPLAYLLGEKEFFGLRLQVDPRVLVPRPDTETLVEWALELLQHRLAPRVIDLGTGSGAIALAIRQARADAVVEAVDRSAGALEVAAANAHALGLAVDLRQASWLEGAQGPYELIVSNPPYVAAGDPHLADLRHEPVSALVAGADGLDDLRAIVQAAPALLAPGGWLLLEHGWHQAQAVRGLLTAAGLVDTASRRDLAGIERCSGACRLELG
jgi:release factor glutamine methyltransferase